MPKAIILMGPPGAGKGTQAELVSDEFGLIHIDTGRYLESLYRDNRMPAIIRAEFKRGDIVDPEWVLKIFKEEIEKIGGVGFGIVFSGSPRTTFEAFGSNKHLGLIRSLTKRYGKKNLLIFEIKVPPRTTIERNSKRKVCSVCWKPNLLAKTLRVCPFCGGKLIKRVQDKPHIIRQRLREYKERTEPVIKELSRQGFKITSVDGRPKPSIVFERISKHLK